jgi:hypothetical protein
MRPDYPIPNDKIPISDLPPTTATTAAMNEIIERDRLPYRVLHLETMATHMMELLEGLEWLGTTTIDSRKDLIKQVNTMKKRLNRIELRDEGETRAAAMENITRLADFFENFGGIELQVRQESATKDKKVKSDWTIRHFPSLHLWIVWEDKSISAFQNFAPCIIQKCQKGFSFDDTPQRKWENEESIIAKVCKSLLTRPSSFFVVGISCYGGPKSYPPVGVPIWRK